MCSLQLLLLISPTSARPSFWSSAVGPPLTPFSDGSGLFPSVSNVSRRCYVTVAGLDSLNHPDLCLIRLARARQDLSLYKRPGSFCFGRGGLSGTLLWLTRDQGSLLAIVLWLL